MISVEEYRRLVAGKRSFWEAYSGFREGVGLESYYERAVYNVRLPVLISRYAGT